MAYEQNPVEYVKSIIATDAKTGWNSAHVAGKLSDDVIDMTASCFKDLDKQTKLDIMAAFLHFRFRDLVLFRNSFTEINEIASKDADESVRIMADMLSTYIEEQVLNIQIEHWNHPSSVLNKAKASIKEHGINFHAPEHMFLNADIRTIPSHVSNNYTRWEPTLTHQFEVTNEIEGVIHAIDPFEQLRVLAESEERAEQIGDSPASAPQKRPSVTEMPGTNKRIMTTAAPAQGHYSHFASPPTTPTGGSFPLRSARPPPPNRTPSGSSLFITKPRQRPTGKPIQRTPSGGRSAAQMPRGFQRPQRVQMLDFNTASEFQQNNSEAIRKANEDMKAKKEGERLEKKRVAEEKKKAAELKKANKSSVNPIEESTQESEQPKPPPQLPVKKAYTGKKSEF